MARQSQNINKGTISLTDENNIVHFMILNICLCRLVFLLYTTVLLLLLLLLIIKKNGMFILQIKSEN